MKEKRAMAFGDDDGLSCLAYLVQYSQTGLLGMNVWRRGGSSFGEPQTLDNILPNPHVDRYQSGTESDFISLGYCSKRSG